VQQDFNMVVNLINIISYMNLAIRSSKYQNCFIAIKNHANNLSIFVLARRTTLFHKQRNKLLFGIEERRQLFTIINICLGKIIKGPQIDTCLQDGHSMFKMY
jgi:hypothetical protein